MNREALIKSQIEESTRLKKYLATNVEVLMSIANELVRGFCTGNKVLLFGNGGSAADAQHIASELAGRFYRDREPLPAIALTTNNSSLTAIANDYGYEAVFVRQLQGLAKKGDAENLPYLDNTFDLVYSWGVIHHTPDTIRALEEILRVTRIGGKMKIMVYNRRSLSALYRYLRFSLLRGKPFRSISWILYHHTESIGTKAFTIVK